MHRAFHAAVHAVTAEDGMLPVILLGGVLSLVCCIGTCWSWSLYERGGHNHFGLASKVPQPLPKTKQTGHDMMHALALPPPQKQAAGPPRLVESFYRHSSGQELRLGASLDDIASAGPESSFDVVAPSMQKLLHARISGGCTLDLLQDTSAGLTQVCSIHLASETFGVFEIVTPYNAKFGKLKIVAPGRIEIRRDDGILMVLEGGTDSLHFSARDFNKRPVGFSKINNEDYKHIAHFEVRSGPNADGVLIFACVLAVALFSSTSPSQPPPAAYIVQGSPVTTLATQLSMQGANSTTSLMSAGTVPSSSALPSRQISRG